MSGNTQAGSGERPSLPKEVQMCNKLTFDQIIAGEGEFLPTIPGSSFGPLKNSAPPIVCADGESLSVQAGRMLYSTPRDDEGPYTAVEVGFPSVSPPYSWAEYFDGTFPVPHWLPYRITLKILQRLVHLLPRGPVLRTEEDDPTESVYAYIPVALVREFIEAHGGEALAEVDMKDTDD